MIVGYLGPYGALNQMLDRKLSPNPEACSFNGAKSQLPDLYTLRTIGSQAFKRQTRRLQGFGLRDGNNSISNILVSTRRIRQIDNPNPYHGGSNDGEQVEIEVNPSGTWWFVVGQQRVLVTPAKEYLNPKPYDT